jgi:hypothetical protein
MSDPFVTTEATLVPSVSALSERAMGSSSCRMPADSIAYQGLTG